MYDYLGNQSFSVRGEVRLQTADCTKLICANVKRIRTRHDDDLAGLLDP